ncbi:MAG TPA: D-aminoacylase [Patescibacteria group bacterium]|nr:D-aminoacylase [Patescibacteria group bacterium]
MPALAIVAAVSTLIVHATVVDGTGAPGRVAAVRIEQGRIAAIGELEPRPGEEVVDAAGLTLVPGFIDTHSHADGELFDHLDAIAATNQGITTAVVGQDGDAPYPLADFFARLERTPAAINVAAYAGHGTLRAAVMGDDYRRAATRSEVGRMRDLLGKEMDAGALGLSTGLEYDPGIYSDPKEVLALAKVAAAHGGRYISHVRSEDRNFWSAIDEIIAIGRKGRLPVQVSHIKLAMTSLWGKAPELLARLDAARAGGVDITSDIYPYLAWHSTLTVLFPKRDFSDLEEARLVVREIVQPDGLLLTQFDAHPEWVGHTLAEIAAERKAGAAETLVELLRLSEARRKETGDAGEGIIGTSMTEPDLEKLMAWPHANICTDGSLDGEHPRGYGSFTRVLGRYVRERRVMTLEEAVHKMTALAAAHVGITDRGLVREGMAADLVLLDPATVIDHATMTAPHAISDGVRSVWVNGAVVYADGKATAQRPGTAIKRAPAAR